MLKMMMEDRKLGLDSMFVNSTQGFDDLDLNFRMHTYLRSLIEPFKWYNTNFAKVRVRIACFEESLENYWNISSEAYIFFQTGNLTHSLFVLPKTETEKMITYDLSGMFSFKSDYEFCQPEMITAYSDKLFTFVLNLNRTTQLVSNPTKRNDIKEGVINPEIQLSYTVDDLFLPTLFLSAKKRVVDAKFLFKNYTLLFEFCDDKPIAIMDP